MTKLFIFASAAMLMFSTACSHSKKNESKIDTPKVQAKVENKEVAKNQKLADKTINCLVGQDQRVISLDKEPNRCEVHYTKFGEKSQVAWAEATPSLCTDVFKNIRSNIEEKGFKCELSQPQDNRQTASSK